MANLIEITSVSQWNSLKKSDGLLIVDFHAEWCQPCKAISPVYAKLAESHPDVTFLRVDVDSQKAIAQKYQISAMPTFLAFRGGNVLDTLKGADPRALAALISRNEVALPPSIPQAALPFKERGNDLFKQEKWDEAIEEYTQGLAKAKSNAILLTNRSAAYLKSGKIDQALKDGKQATTNDPSWSKGWIRYAEALGAVETPDKDDIKEAYSRALKTMAEGIQKQDIKARYNSL